MDEAQRRVTFYFGQDAEVRYVAHVPGRGDLARHAGTLWVATAIEQDPFGAPQARFDRPGNVVRRVRLDATRMRHLSAMQRDRSVCLAKSAAHIAERASELRARMSNGVAAGRQ